MPQYGAIQRARVLLIGVGQQSKSILIELTRFGALSVELGQEAWAHPQDGHAVENIFGSRHRDRERVYSPLVIDHAKKARDARMQGRAVI